MIKYIDNIDYLDDFDYFDYFDYLPRHRGKTGTLHLLQVKLFTFDLL